MAKWFQKWGVFDSARSLGEYLFWGVCILFNTTGAAVLAATAAYTTWYWEAYGLIGVAFAFLLSALIIPSAFILIALATILAAQAKQRWNSPVSATEDEDTPPTSGTKFDGLLSDIEALKGIVQLHDERSESQIQTVDRKYSAYADVIHGLSIRISEIENLLKPSRQLTILESLGAVSKPANNRFESIENKIANVESSIGSFASPLREQVAKLDERMDRLNADTSETFEKVRQVFYSERILEAYRDRTKDIEAIAESLDDPLSKPELYSDWSKWDHDFYQFKSQLSILDRFIKSNVDIDFDFFATPNEKYASSNWSYNFRDMTDDQKFNYKTYRILLGNYRNAKESISSKVYNGTFLTL